MRAVPHDRVILHNVAGTRAGNPNGLLQGLTRAVIMERVVGNPTLHRVDNIDSPNRGVVNLAAGNADIPTVSNGDRPSR